MNVKKCANTFWLIYLLDLLNLAVKWHVSTQNST